MQRTLERVRAEFLEMPGLQLTAAQMARLCGLESGTCKAVLDELVDEQFLAAKPGGTYARLSDGGVPAVDRQKAPLR